MSNRTVKECFFIYSMAFCLFFTGNLMADGNTIPDSWITPYLKTDYDKLVWGCRLKNCHHVAFELKAQKEGVIEYWTRRKSTPLQLAILKRYTEWWEKDGKRIQQEWRSGAVKPADAKYLPLVKTEFWNEIVNRPLKGNNPKDSHLGYWRWKKFPVPESPEEEELQQVLEAGLKVMHKIYNGKPLTTSDKMVFQDWLIAYYCMTYIGSVTPEGLPGDSWKEFKITMLGKNAAGENSTRGILEPGGRPGNFRMISPDTYWSKSGFDPNFIYDNSWHLRPEKLDQVLATFQRLAEDYEPTSTWPLIRPRSWPEGTPDEKGISYFHNYMKKEGKPVIFSNWLTSWDEGNNRIVKGLHLCYRAFAGKLNFLFPEAGYRNLCEKDNLLFNTDPAHRAARILKDNLAHAPMLPTPVLGTDQDAYGGRFCILDKTGRLLRSHHYMCGDDPKDTWNYLIIAQLGMDSYLVDCFRRDFAPEKNTGAPASPVGEQRNGQWNSLRQTQDGYETAPYMIPYGPRLSKFGKTREAATANGYNVSEHAIYYWTYEIVGEVLDVDAQAHTMTVLREEYRDENYPSMGILKRFGIPVDGGTQEWADHFSRCKKEGNSIAARTIKINLNSGVSTFINGCEVAGEGDFEKGDVVGIMTGDQTDWAVSDVNNPPVKWERRRIIGKDGKKYPYLIRGFRFNFPPTIEQPKDMEVGLKSGKQTVTLTGISDNNAVCTQKISITATSSEPGITGQPQVEYKDGESTAKLTFTPVKAGTAEIKVTVKDSGGTFDGGKDTTEVGFKVKVK